MKTKVTTFILTILIASALCAQTLEIRGKAFAYPWGDYDNISIYSKYMTDADLKTRRFCLWPADANALAGYLDDWLNYGCESATGVCYNPTELGADQRCIFGRNRAAAASGGYYDTFTLDVACRDSVEGVLYLSIGSGEATSGLGGDLATGSIAMRFQLSAADAEQLRDGIWDWMGTHNNNVLLSK